MNPTDLVPVPNRAPADARARVADAPHRFVAWPAAVALALLGLVPAACGRGTEPPPAVPLPPRVTAIAARGHTGGPPVRVRNDAPRQTDAPTATATDDATDESPRSIVATLAARTPAGPEPALATGPVASVADGHRFVSVAQAPVSTLPLHAGAASYPLVRRFLASGRLPPSEAVRIEEMLHYFDYDLAPPPPDHPYPMTLYSYVVEAPWQTGHRLVFLALVGREAAGARSTPANLVFLVDTSASMSGADRLPAVKAALHALADELGGDDRVAIVTTAAGAPIALASTRGTARVAVHGAIDALQVARPGPVRDSLAAAYETAAAGWLPDGANRVVLITDADFRVPPADRVPFARLVQTEARHGIALRALTFGAGTDPDDAAAELAALEGGAHRHVRGPAEAMRAIGSLQVADDPIARGARARVELNPARVAAYRLLGYADGPTAAVDGADLLPGQVVVALYEVAPLLPAAAEVSPPLRYGAPLAAAAAAPDEILELVLQYRDGSGAEQTVAFQVQDDGASLETAPRAVQLAVAVAELGLLLGDGARSGDPRWLDAVSWAEASLGADPGGTRSGLVETIERAWTLAGASR